jgi:hypothetical protein
MATQSHIIPVVTSQVKYAQLMTKIQAMKLEPELKKLLKDLSLVVSNSVSEVNDRVNQGQAAGADANKPNAGFPSRIWFSTDTGKLFVDNGTAWIQIN